MLTDNRIRSETFETVIHQYPTAFDGYRLHHHGQAFSSLLARTVSGRSTT